MLLKGTFLGDIEIEEDKILNFVKPILGFKEKKFVILVLKDYLPFKVLQSIDNPKLSFIIIEPFYIKSNYAIKLHDDVLKDLKIKDIKKDIFYACLVSIHSQDNITANLKAPILINNNEKLAMQYILDDNRYLVREKIEFKSVKQKQEVK